MGILAGALDARHRAQHTRLAATQVARCRTDLILESKSCRRLSRKSGLSLLPTPTCRSCCTEGLPSRSTSAIVASLEDLLTTKLKAILDRAEVKDYRDIAAMLAAGVPLEKALGAFATMYRRDPGLPL